MGRFEGVTITGTSAPSGQTPPPPQVAYVLPSDAEEDEALVALPGFQLINEWVNALKEKINNGERGCTCVKASAYFGYRLISYSLFPLVLNAISALISGILTLVLLPTACCENSHWRWAWLRFQGSISYTLQSIWDLTCDLRQLTGLCCCPPDSVYLHI